MNLKSSPYLIFDNSLNRLRPKKYRDINLNLIEDEQTAYKFFILEA